MAKRWYYEGDERWFAADNGSREGAIELGREHWNDGRAFNISEGEALGAWSRLFENFGNLADFIDDCHEDQSFEEGFCEESGLGKAELAPLLDNINALWRDFVAKHDPRSNKLNLGPTEVVPPTSEWLAQQTADGGSL